MRNVALRIEYDGTDFVGSQWQNNGRSVQGELEGAWEQLTQERQRINLAGRTDAGVHARGQVANLRTETRHDLATIQRGLNAIVPEDVAVLEAWEAPIDFHARHSAIRREYRYLIDSGPVGSPLLRRHAVHVPRSLDAAAIDEALRALLGTHDFAAFAGGQPEGSTVRTCYAASCAPAELWGQPLIAVDLTANAFLRHMVRNIIGTLLLVGEGKIDSMGFAAVLASRDRRRAGRTAPAHGLYLMAVHYP
ncbi:MAG: tRNA pseudouridine(38-40) synthase TruA [Roseiflexaceae bacterium]